MLWFPVLTLWLCVSGGGAFAARDKSFYHEATHAQHFESFKATYHKQYATPEEEQHRFNAFKKNLATINKLNADDKYATYDINDEADLTEDEIEAKYTDIDVGSIGLDNVKTLSQEDLPTGNPHPDSFDWRDKGIVPKPRDQKNCSASYAFATVANIESHSLMAQTEHMLFSVQQVIDCDERNKGCNGGDPIDACKYYAKHGFMKEEDYKYVGTHNKCAYDREKIVGQVPICVIMDFGEECADDALFYGPISALIDGRQLQWYTGGILTKCAFKGYNYAMLLTGYGHDKNGVRYWSLQNSRGENWGEKGYVRIKRGVHCLGIANRKSTLSWPTM